MKNSQRRSQRGKRFVSICSSLLVLCWFGFAGWNLSKRPEALNAFSVGLVIVVAVVLHLLPKAVAKVVLWISGDSRTSEAIREIRTMRVARDDFQPAPSQSQIETGLPEAWRKLVQDSDDLLLNLVAEKAKSLHGHKPTRGQVLEYLKSLQESETQTKEAPPPPSQPVSEPTATPAGSKAPDASCCYHGRWRTD